MAALDLSMSGLDIHACLPKDLPKLSPSSVAILRAAVKCARERGHGALGTEHVLWALLSDGTGTTSSTSRPSRAAVWIAQNLSKGGETVEAISEKVKTELEDRPLWTASSEKSPVPLPLTSCLNDSFHLIAQFSNGPVTDPLKGEAYKDGLVASEFLLAGLMVEGTSVAADILQRLSRGKINSQRILDMIHVDVRTLVRKSDDKPWTVERWTNERCAAAGSPTKTPASWFPEFGALPSLEALGKSPTATSNWLVPGHLLIGGKPGGYYHGPDADLKAYLASGVRAFTCLIGEYRSMEGYMKRYPEVAKEIGGKSKACTTLDFLYFPIYDFETPTSDGLQSLVLELKRRLLAGDVMFIHCLGGHGRTGMVVIPLMMALYSVDFRSAETFVNQATQRHRQADHGYLHSMPETSQQADLAEQSEAYVKKKRR